MINKELTLDEKSKYLPLRESVFATLRQAILHGELKPGERLLEISLSEKLGVSRTPIRDAIKMLEDEGLVTIKPRHGAIVASITEQNLKDVLEVRKDLDAFSCALACDRIGKEQLAKLKDACDAFDQATQSRNAGEIAKADVAFHSVIVEATGNRKLFEIISSLSEQMYRYRFEYIKDISDYENLVQEHRQIYEYIRIGDKEKAAALARTHIDNQEQSILKILRSEK